jgi:hypothetical protein
LSHIVAAQSSISRLAIVLDGQDEVVVIDPLDRATAKIAIGKPFIDNTIGICPGPIRPDRTLGAMIRRSGIARQKIIDYFPAEYEEHRSTQDDPCGVSTTTTAAAG